MLPYMKTLEIKKFTDYLSKATNYFEFGSGGSTIYACNMEIPNITSIENDLKWYNKLMNESIIKQNIQKNNLQIKLYDLKCTWWKHVSWAEFPESIENINKTYWLVYSNSILECDEIQDLVLIDGRLRVACALKSYYKMDQDSFLLFHDYISRPQYNIIEKFFTIIESQDELYVFKKKMEISEIELKECINKYKYFID